jgi:hypothetical protein
MMALRVDAPYALEAVSVTSQVSEAGGGTVITGSPGAGAGGSVDAGAIVGGM